MLTRGPRLSHGRPILHAALGLLLVGIVAGGLASHSSAGRGLAAQLTPPPPPGTVPTPIGPPPAPPTPTPTPGPAATVTQTPSVSPTATATSTTRAALSFSLDAARLSKVNDPGDLRGLVAVRPGSRTWLMMYFTLRNVPRKMTRITTYVVQFQGKVIYKVSFKGSIKRGESGRYSRYATYTIPPSAPYGRYVYQASLVIGRKSKTKSWKFSVATREREVAGGQALLAPGRGS